jgi:hypothetical protein
MTRACIALQKRLLRNEKNDIEKITALCHASQISIDHLTLEIQRILAVFAPDTISDEYAVLGLDANADLGQIKQAFRKLSLKFHPDAGSSTSNSDKFIEVCQAYKSIISRHNAGNQIREQGTVNWYYRKERTIPTQKKRKNIILFSTLAALLFFFSIVAPIFYKKKVMRKNLNYTDPVLISKSAPVATQLSPEDPAAEESSATTGTQTTTVMSQLTVESQPAPGSEIDIPEPVKTEQTAQEIQQEQKVINKSSLSSLTETQSEIEKNEIITEKESQPTSEQFPLQITATPKTNISKQPSAKITSITPQKIKSRTTKIVVQQTATSHQKDIAKPIPKPIPKPILPSLTSLNNFLDAYTAAYESKNFQQFSLFFTADATENDKSFSDQQERYVKLFQSIDTINFNIGILSSVIQNGDILITGRFQAIFAYPQAQPIQRKGAITILLKNNGRDYLIKKLNYTFNKI